MITHTTFFFDYNYTTKLNGKHRKREFHIASVSAEQIITDHLYRRKNNMSEWTSVAEKRILAGIERHYVKGGINLQKDDLIRMILEKYDPEEKSIIKNFRDHATDYKSLLK